MSDEVWTAAYGWGGVFSVSSLGRVRRDAPAKGTKAGNMLQCSTNQNGYRLAMLRQGKRVEAWRLHRLVLCSFIGPPEGRRRDGEHLDGDRQNNALTNLAWSTRAENNKRKSIHGTQPRGERVATSKLSDAQAEEIRREGKIILDGVHPHAPGGAFAKKAIVAHSELAKRFGVSQSLVSAIVAGKRRKRA